jgi:signal transduction histidine kinase
MLPEPEMQTGVLTSGRNTVEQICALKRPPKPARGLAGSPGIMSPDRLECLDRELVRLRRQLVKKNTELEKVGRDRSRTLGMTAHDLRNPISGILNASEYLLGDAHGLAEDQLLLLRAITTSSKFMLSLINDIVQLSTMEAGELRLALQPTDLVLLAEQNLSRNRLVADRKQIRLELIVDGALPFVRIDPLKMNQAVDNLVTNAIKFSEPGTKIEIRMHAQNDVVGIAVRDEGPGITPAERGTVFKLFRRGKCGPVSQTPGTGLGLAISKRIVQAHGGRIELESQVGKGSTFTVTIPLAINAKARRPSRASLDYAAP